MIQAMALGDVLTVILEHENNLTPEVYKNWHPGGKLGASLLRAWELAHVGDDIPLVFEDDIFEDAVAVMGRPVRFGCVGVVDKEGVLAGIFVDGDIRRRIAEGVSLNGKKMRDIMKSNPQKITANTLAGEALRILNEKQIQTLFLIDENGKPVGIVSFHDLLKAGIC
jgi:arabinose-5-phosphate isomerase